MAIELLGPDKEIKEQFDVAGLKEFEIYDVLAYLIKSHGLAAVSLELKNYLNDQAETFFGKMEFEDGAGLPVGLAAARALDACGATAESLHNFATEYEL